MPLLVRKRSLSTPLSKPQENNILKQQWGLNWTWDEGLGECTIPASDCFDEIVVVGEPTVLQDFHNAIQSGPSAIADFFNSSGGSTLFTRLYDPVFEDELDFLQSGNSTIVQKGNNPYYYLVFDGNNLLFVLQIVSRRP